MNKKKQPLFKDGKVFVVINNPTSDDNANEIDSFDENGKYYFYKSLGITDQARFNAAQHDKKIDFKLRVRQDMSIQEEMYMKINDKIYRVIGAFHFTNDDGYKLSDITLMKYGKDWYFKP